MRRLATTCCVLMLAASAFLAHSPAAEAQLTRSEASLLAAINDVRAAHRLPRLRIDRRLSRVARAHSFDMIKRNYFAHGAFAARMARSGAHGPFFGENLAWGSGGFGSASSIVRAWLNSPGHRANLLRPGFRRVGLGAPMARFGGVPNVRVVTADFAGR